MRKSIRHFNSIGVLAFIGIAMALSQFFLRQPLPTAVSHVGVTTFAKYGLAPSNNPVEIGHVPLRFKQNWTFTAREPLQQASMAHGVVYVSGDGGNLSSRLQNRIYALDAMQGRLLWSRKLNNMSMTTPIVGDGLVFIGTGTEQFGGNNLSRENNLYATHIVRGTGPSAIYALNQRTGQIVWQRATVGEDMPSFLLERKVLYVANGHGHLYALRAASGRILWTLSLGSYVSMASLSGSGHDLFVSGAHPYALYIVNVNTHHVICKTNFPNVFAGSDDSSPAYQHGRVYLEGTEGSWIHPMSTLFAVNVRTGKTLFRTSLGSGPLPMDIEVSAPVVYGHMVYVGSPITNSEYAIDALSGKIRWRFHASGPISESAAVTRRHLYVGDGNGFLYVLNPYTGHEEGGRYFSGVFAADFPLVVGGTLYQPDEDGQMLALPRNSLLNSTRHRVANLPIASGVLGEEIIRGETVFMGQSLGSGESSCDTCHLEGGTESSYQNGRVIPSLLGQAALFPKISSNHIVTLNMQINHCLYRMGDPALNAGDPRLHALNLYLHWLSSGWQNNLNSGSSPSANEGGGCK